jgi:hypothetical protein
MEAKMMINKNYSRKQFASTLYTALLTLKLDDDKNLADKIEENLIPYEPGYYLDEQSDCLSIEEFPVAQIEIGSELAYLTDEEQASIYEMLNYLPKREDLDSLNFLDDGKGIQCLMQIAYAREQIHSLAISDTKESYFLYFDDGLKSLYAFKLSDFDKYLEVLYAHTYACFSVFYIEVLLGREEFSDTEYSLNAFMQEAVKKIPASDFADKGKKAYARAIREYLQVEFCDKFNLLYSNAHMSASQYELLDMYRIYANELHSVSYHTFITQPAFEQAWVY